ncbi:MAG: phosphoenolpyruvate--protein phosphotransferase [Flavobacteriaceae bacterium]
MTEVYTGKVVSKGIAIAPARKVALPPELFVPDHGIEDLKHEQALFDKALAGARDYVSRWKATMNGRLEGEALELYDAYDEMLQDPELVIQTKDLIDSSSKNAAHCFFRVTEDYATTLIALNDPYLSARSEDIRMLADLVIRLLSGQEIQELTWTDKAVIVSRQLTPQQLSSMNSDAIVGIVLVEGGLTDHTAILAQALSIPLLIGVSEQVLEIQNETPTLLDLEAGVFVVNPKTEKVHNAQEKLRVLQEHAEQARLQAAEKAVTKSGRPISIEANVGGLLEVEQAKVNGADGIGLFRTELAFLQQKTLLSEQDHYDVYASILEGYETVTHTIRLLDFGSDKPLSYLPVAKEENPAMGLRALRLGFEQYEALLQPQIRALLRLSERFSIRILCPMIATEADCKRIRDLIEGEAISIKAQGINLEAMPAIGIMVEIPNVAIRPKHFVSLADFFSFGTNDLAQFLMAADRSNSKLSSYFEASNETILELIAAFVKEAAMHQKSVSICGELAADTRYTQVFVDMGVSALSMAPSRIPEIKQKVRLIH